MGMTIIKDYEMPHNCYDCDLHNYHECDLTSESIEEDYCWNGDSREKHCPLREVEGIPKAEYENRLKADMVDMLEEIQAQIDDLWEATWNSDYRGGFKDGCIESNNLIQQKINSLKEAKDGENNN